MRLGNAVNREGIRRKTEVGRGEGKEIFLPIHPPSPPSFPFVTRAPKPVQTPLPLHPSSATARLPPPNKLKRLRVDRGVIWWWELTG